MGRKKDQIATFRENLVSAGAEILGPTNPYEVLRFRTVHGVGVIYKGRRGETWNTEAIKARDHLEQGRGQLSPVFIVKRKTNSGVVEALLIRDGKHCFFCGMPLEGDITVEHLVAIAHGGPNHISNLFLAHAACNQAVGHMAAPHKIAIRDKMRKAARTPAQPVSDEERGQ